MNELPAMAPSLRLTVPPGRVTLGNATTDCAAVPEMNAVEEHGGARLTPQPSGGRQHIFKTAAGATKAELFSRNTPHVTGSAAQTLLGASPARTLARLWTDRARWRRLIELLRALHYHTHAGVAPPGIARSAVSPCHRQAGLRLAMFWTRLRATRLLLHLNHNSYLP